MSRLDPEGLERLVGQIARSQPPRRAPATLQARVLDAVARQDRRSAWTGGFDRWPAAARIAFAVLTLAAAVASARLPGLATPLAAVREFVFGLASAGALGHLIFETAVRALPAAWLCAAAAALVTLYAAVAALFSLTHRSLGRHS